MDLDYTNSEILQYALDTGTIDLTQLQANYEMKRRNELLTKHTYSVWQGTNGYWYTYLPMPDGKKILKKLKNRDALDNAIVSYYRALEASTVTDIFKEWTKYKLEYGGIQNQTYDRYTRDFKRFFENQPIAKMDIRKVTDSVIDEFIFSTIKEKELTAKAYANLRTLISGIWKYAKKQHLTDISISTFFKDLELPKNIFRKRKITDEEAVFTDKEICLIIKHISKQKENLINYGILLAIETGLRVGELSALKHSDSNDKVLHISRTEIIYKDENNKYVYEVREFPKTEAGERDVILTDRAVQILKQIQHMNPFGEYMFERNGERIKENGFSQKLRRICNHLGIHPRSIHQIRKTYASKLLQAHVDPQTIVKQLGHADLSTTVNNYYYNTVSHTRAVQQIQKAVNYQ